MPQSTNGTAVERCESIKDAGVDAIDTLADAGFTVPIVETAVIPGGVRALLVPKETSDQAWICSRNNPVFLNFSLPSPDRTDRGSIEGSVFTARFVRSDFTVSDGVNHLIEEGSVEKAIKVEMSERNLDRTFAEAVVCLAIARVAVGWAAEVRTGRTDRFSKMSEENDMAGQDFYDNSTDDLIQLRRWTFGRWHKGSGDTVDKNDNPIVYYTEVGGEMFYSRDYTDITAKLRDFHSVSNQEIQAAWFLKGQLNEI